MKRRRLLRTVFALALAGALGLHLAGGYLCKPSPKKLKPPPEDLAARDIEFPSDSGSMIHGWLSLGATPQNLGPGAAAPLPKAKGAVLLVAGIHGNRGNMVERAEFLHRAGYDALLIDLQATGESPGRAVTFGWLESRDILAAVAFLRRERPDEPVAIIGQSLGAAATVLAAPPLHVEAVVVEAVFPTIADATRNRLVDHIGFLGRLLTPLLLADLRPHLGITQDELRPIDHIGAIQCPLFIIAGAEDRYTTAEETEQLFAKATSSAKDLWLLPGAGHVNLHHANPSEYERRILGFLQKSMIR